MKNTILIKVAKAYRELNEKIEEKLDKLVKSVEYYKTPQGWTLAQRLATVTRYPLHTTEDVVRICERQIDNKYIENISLVDFSVKALTIAAKHQLEPVDVVLNYDTIKHLRPTDNAAEAATKRMLNSLDTRINHPHYPTY